MVHVFLFLGFPADGPKRRETALTGKCVRERENVFLIYGNTYGEGKSKTMGLGVFKYMVTDFSQVHKIHHISNIVPEGSGHPGAAICLIYFVKLCS